METCIERLTIELRRLEGLLAMPRGYVMKVAKGTGCWVDITDQTRAQWARRAADLQRQLQSEIGTADGPRLTC